MLGRVSRSSSDCDESNCLGGTCTAFACDNCGIYQLCLPLGLDRGEKLIAVGLTTRSRVVVHGTNRIGKPTAAVIEGDELAKHLLHRARKGCLVARKMKLVGLGSET